MDKKGDSSISIRQILEVNLAVIFCILSFVGIVSRNGKNGELEVANLSVQMQYIEAIVENSESDYVYSVQTEYLGKTEIIEIKQEKMDSIEEVQTKVSDVPPTEFKKVIEVKATAYCLCKKCCGKSESHPEYGVTASGLKIVPGTNMKVIAVDPNVVPLGSEVYVESVNGVIDYGYAIAADTGSAIKNLKIDLYMDTHEEAYRWGIKNVKLYVI